jgi:hypothetical protein
MLSRTIPEKSVENAPGRQPLNSCADCEALFVQGLLKCANVLWPRQKDALVTTASGNFGGCESDTPPCPWLGSGFRVTRISDYGDRSPMHSATIQT